MVDRVRVMGDRVAPTPRGTVMNYEPQHMHEHDKFVCGSDIEGSVR